ncbi:MAG TPA: hypothetical protein VJ783_22840 [Pirellulales bacterium]|nr:hypothetical protein [Pirellulales bacterium]
MLKRGFNPFYVLLVIVGIAFSITAFAYFVMTLKDAQAAGAADANQAGAALLTFLDDYGAIAMAVELVLLALTTVGAISTDRYWMCRSGSNDNAR